MTTWEDIADKIRLAVISGVTYVAPSKITVINSVSDYFMSNPAQSTVDDFAILIAPPEGSSESAESRIGGWLRKSFFFEIAVISKINPNAQTRIWGEGKKGIFDVQADVVRALEHKNFGGYVDNKAGVNFEAAWSIVPLEGRAFTAYHTIYTVVKTEK